MSDPVSPKMLKVRPDVFAVTAFKHDPTTGEKVEPEQQTATRVIDQAVAATTTGGAPLGEFKTQVLASQTVADLSAGIRRFCKDCKHFRNRDWIKIVNGADRSGDLKKREAVNEIRAALLMTQNATISDVHKGADDDFDVENAMRAMGICHALTELEQDLITVHPMACCPDKLTNGTPIVTPTAPNGLFVLKDREARKGQMAAYDKLMAKARGK